jgi:hypothetical protein
MSDEAIAAAKRIPAWPVPSEFRTEYHCPPELSVPGWEEPEEALMAASSWMERLRRHAAQVDEQVAAAQEKLKVATTERERNMARRLVASEWFHETAKAVARGSR